MSALSYARSAAIDVFAILRKSLDRAIFLFIFMLEARLNGLKITKILFNLGSFVEDLNGLLIRSIPALASLTIAIVYAIAMG